MESTNIENILNVKNNLCDCPNNIENGVDVKNDLGDWTPELGMSFDSEQAAYDFYKAYGGRIDFRVRKGYVNKNKTGDVTSRLFYCNKEEFRAVDKRDTLTKNARQKIRTGCEARFRIKFDKCNRKYVINAFNEYHNHALVFPECAHMLSSQRQISTTQAIEVELAEQFRIPFSIAYELMGREVVEGHGYGYLEGTLNSNTRASSIQAVNGQVITSTGYGPVEGIRLTVNVVMILSSNTHKHQIIMGTPGTGKKTTLDY